MIRNSENRLVTTAKNTQRPTLSAGIEVMALSCSITPSVDQGLTLSFLIIKNHKIIAATKAINKAVMFTYLFPLWSLPTGTPSEAGSFCGVKSFLAPGTLKSYAHL